VLPTKVEYVWELLILKILDSRFVGEATTADIARELAILDRHVREHFRSQPIENGIFGAGLVEIPRKGLWRITDQGRAYLRIKNEYSCKVGSH
jgi:hypothetical protein